MIIGLITIIMSLMGGGSGADHVTLLEMLSETSSLVEEHVEDLVRSAAAEEILQTMQTAVTSTTTEIQARKATFITVDRDYNSTRADFQVVVDDVNEIWMAMERSLIDGYMKLRGQITAGEWARIFTELQKKLH